MQVDGEEPAGVGKIFLQQLFYYAIFALSVVAVVKLYAFDPLAFRWAIVIGVFYGLSYVYGIITTCKQKYGMCRALFLLHGITPIMVGTTMTNSQFKSLSGIRFLFNTVPSFGLGIYSFANTKGTINEDGVFLALLILTSISFGILALILFCFVCCFCCAGCAALFGVAVAQNEHSLEQIAT